MSTAPPWLELDRITKRFFGIPVLEEVSVRVHASRILGLVGENGAGKSTLMNILGGIHAPDAGTMRLAGRPYAPRRPTDAARRGIGFIHQELNLFGNLSIAENLFLNDFPRTHATPFIHRAALRRQAAARLAQVGLDLPPETLVERLSAGERQLVEVARALGTGSRLIIFDEPTTSLTTRETARLFDLLQRLRHDGLALIYISHALDDVLRLSDDIVVLRDGRVAGQGPRAAFDPDRLIALMVGRSIQQLFPARPPASPGDLLLRVRGLGQPGLVHDINLDLHAGEVLGLAGLMGSGRSELARILFGLDPHTRGHIEVRGESAGIASPRRAIRRGLAFLTESRREDGLCLEASIAENLALVSLPAYARAPLGWIDHARLGSALRRFRAAVRLTPTAADDQPVKTLSGGNQQKVVLAKWLLGGPRVILLDEPTRGIDVGAKQEIYQLIADLAAQGAGVLLISSELEELIGLCDRILVLRRGEVTDAFPRARFDREAILRAAMHESRLGQPAPADPA